ncbi:HAD family hydrolase [Anaerorhabdus sp.]|uniref:HAD family hydrolase n=1 Tax=Anaerorhabdus sp. TaxID=1872524 RepID=UPI002FCB221E
MKNKIIIYDFDGTLTPYSVPKIDLMDKIGCTFEQYEAKMKEWLIAHPGKDIFDSYYMTFLNVLSEYGYPLTDETFAMGGNLTNFNPGVLEYFEDTKDLAQHYLVSSGFQVPLEHSAVSKYFTKIYGTIFSYDANHVATGIAYAMNDKRKVDKIQEICAMNHLDDLNLENVVYIGDGLTDAYAMSFVKEHGGTPIFVYQPHETSDAFEQLKNKGIVDIAFVADYSKGTDLYNTLLQFIQK